MRYFFALCSFVMLLATSANAAQGQFTKSPLVCFEVSGVATIADRMVNRAQIGALGFEASFDIMRGQGSCSYNSDARTVYPEVIWLESPRWLFMLEVVDVGNDILMWRPADILDKEEWRLPRGCLVFQSHVVRGKGISPSRFLNQNIVLSARCTRAKPRVNQGGFYGKRCPPFRSGMTEAEVRAWHKKCG